MGGHTPKVKPPFAGRSIQADAGRYTQSRLPEKEIAELDLPDIVGRRVSEKEALALLGGDLHVP